ncbi:MAG: FAD-binding protein, partial [Deltaproteobacteria bacterium]|nr:FAD-binding protein [Deltaproteobacteria bacterium]
LETELFEGSQLGEWQDKTYLSPIMLSGASCDDFVKWGGTCGVLGWDFQQIAENTGKDLRGFGPGMMAYFIKAAVIDRKIPAHVNTPVRELVIEDGAVIGVRAEKDGKDFFVKANKGVMLAVGGYDHNEEMARYFEDMPEWKSMCQPYVHGDNIVMGGEIGAALASVPPGNLGLFFGF